MSGFFTSMLFPHFCIGCGREGELLCETCRRKLCQELYAQEHTLQVSQLHRVSATTFASYEHELLRALMQKYKYEGLREVGQGITALFAHALQSYRQNILATANLSQISENARQNHLIIPMPLHPLKERMRGFNQSEPLAMIASHYLGGQLAPGILKKHHMWHAQATITNHADRAKNIQNTFYLAKNAKETLAGRTVILVDDVLTTGATVSEASRVLYNSGALSVNTIAFLRG